MPKVNSKQAFPNISPFDDDSNRQLRQMPSFGLGKSKRHVRRASYAKVDKVYGNCPRVLINNGSVEKFVNSDIKVLSGPRQHEIASHRSDAKGGLDYLLKLKQQERDFTHRSGSYSIAPHLISTSS